MTEREEILLYYIYIYIYIILTTLSGEHLCSKKASLTEVGRYVHFDTFREEMGPCPAFEGDTQLGGELGTHLRRKCCGGGGDLTLREPAKTTGGMVTILTTLGPPRDDTESIRPTARTP